MNTSSPSPIVQNITEPKCITILGSTGSIGTTTLNIIAQHPERFTCEALTAHHNVELLITQALQFRPSCVAIAQEEHYHRLKEALSGTNITVTAGEDAVIEAAQRPSDLVMAGIVGIAGLRPTLAAIERGATIALANKETLVSAGEFVLAQCQKHGATLLPVDSEHSAIFQVFEHHHPDAIEAVTLTASGGPFRTLPPEALAKVTPEQAVTHPNWSMGAKISVDSATMMNKGLEMIEAYHLFPLKAEQIRVIIHPESIIHSMVHYRDGSVLAQMGMPEMATPIAYSMAWPERLEIDTPRLRLTEIAALHFEEPDMARFPCLALARQALEKGRNLPTILNAANEVAVAAFLDNRLAFPHIMKVTEQTLAACDTMQADSLEAVLASDAEARRKAIYYCENS